MEAELRNCLLLFAVTNLKKKLFHHWTIKNKLQLAHCIGFRFGKEKQISS